MTDREDFKKFMKYVSDVDEASVTSHDPAVAEANAKKLQKLGYEAAITPREGVTLVNPARVTSPDMLVTQGIPFTDPNQVYRAHAATGRAFNLDDSVMRAKKNLEGILEGTDEKKLEQLLGDKNIIAAAGPEYQQWLGYYNASKKADDDVKLASAGPGALAPEKRKQFTEQALQLDIQDIQKKLGKKYSPKAVALATQTYRLTFMNGMVADEKDYLPAGAIADRDAIYKLRTEYEGKNKKNLNGLVTSALKNLVRSGEEKSEEYAVQRLNDLVKD